MPSKNSNLDEFNELIQELNTAQNHPVTPRPPALFMADLQRKLLKTYDRPSLSRQGVLRLWKFGGTAVALTVLTTAVVTIWLSLSAQPQTTSPAVVSATRVVATLPAMQENEVETAVSDLLLQESTKLAPVSGSVWIESATQFARESLTDPVQFEVVVGYDVSATADAKIKLQYANPNWGGVGANGHGPVDGMSELMPVTVDQHSITFQFSGSASDMQQIVQSDHPIPVVFLANFVEGDDVIDLLAWEGFPDFPFALDSIDEVRYEGETAVSTPSEESLTVLSVSPQTSTTLSGTTTFDVQLHYRLSSLPEAEIVIAMRPISEGAALLSHAVETITQGEGNITITFDFQPLDANEASDWIMDIQMRAPNAELTAKALASTSPNVSLEDSWRYELGKP